MSGAGGWCPLSLTRKEMREGGGGWHTAGGEATTNNLIYANCETATDVNVDALEI